MVWPATLTSKWSTDPAYAHPTRTVPCSLTSATTSSGAAYATSGPVATGSASKDAGRGLLVAWIGSGRGASAAKVGRSTTGSGCVFVVAAAGSLVVRVEDWVVWVVVTGALVVDVVAWVEVRVGCDGALVACDVGWSDVGWNEVRGGVVRVGGCVGAALVVDEAVVSLGDALERAEPVGPLATEGSPWVGLSPVGTDRVGADLGVGDVSVGMGAGVSSGELVARGRPVCRIVGAVVGQFVGTAVG